VNPTEPGPSDRPAPPPPSPDEAAVAPRGDRPDAAADGGLEATTVFPTRPPDPAPPAQRHDAPLSPGRHAGPVAAPEPSHSSDWASDQTTIIPAGAWPDAPGSTPEWSAAGAVSPAPSATNPSQPPWTGPAAQAGGGSTGQTGPGSTGQAGWQGQPSPAGPAPRSAGHDWRGGQPPPPPRQGAPGQPPGAPPGWQRGPAPPPAWQGNQPPAPPPAWQGNQPPAPPPAWPGNQPPGPPPAWPGNQPPGPPPPWPGNQPPLAAAPPAWSGQPGQPAGSSSTGRPASTAAEESSVSGTSRRSVIIGAGVAAAAGVGGFVWYTAAGPKPRATSPTPGGGSATLAPLSDVPQNGGIVLADDSIVLTRESGNTVHGYSAICTHQGCLVSKVSGGQISCPCHGSVFDANTGAVINGPATAPLPPVRVSVVNGSVVRGGG